MRVGLADVHGIKIGPVDAGGATFAKRVVGKFLDSLPVTQVILVTAAEPGKMGLKSLCKSRL